MPLYDRRCGRCERIYTDLWEKMDIPAPTCECGGTMERAWLAKAALVIGDEIDIEIKHGMCHEDGSPRRFTSRAELNKEAAKRGLVNAVEHQGTKGGDKSRHTTRWF